MEPSQPDMASRQTVVGFRSTPPLPIRLARTDRPASASPAGGSIGGTKGARRAYASGAFAHPELTTVIEPVTSPLPRVCSTN